MSYSNRGGLWHGLWEALLDLVYPPKCPGCRKPAGQHGQWCGDCLLKLGAARYINLGEHRLKYLDSCLALYDYTGALKRVLHDIKFRQARQKSAYLTWLVFAGMAGRELNFDSVIPVPLSRQRLIERGFNQTEVIFGPWAKNEGLVWLDALERVKATLPQWQLPPAERRQNIKGAFAATHLNVHQKNILLVDDIFTTGLTMDECAKVLKRAGALKVHGLALASGAPT